MIELDYCKENVIVELPSLLMTDTMAPVSAWRYISPRSVTTGTAVVRTLMRRSPEDEVYLVLAKDYDRN